MGGAESRVRPRIADARALLGAALAIACATGPVEVRDGRVYHRELGFAVVSPDSLSPHWERVQLDGAELAYRRPGAWMSLQAACGRPLAPPRILAWHLMIGSERTLRASHAVSVGLLEGWTNTFDTVQEGVVIRVKTVTLVRDRCSYDWILSAQRDFEASEPSFDAWWQSFVPDAVLPPSESQG